MKVLHVIDSLGVGGGAEHSLLAMLPEFAAYGIENEVACLVNRDHGLFEEVQRMGISYQVLPGRNLPAQAWSLRRLIKRTKPDVVHATLLISSLATRFATVGLPVAQVHSLVNTTYDPSRTETGDVTPWKLELLRRVDSLSAQLIKGRFHAITEAVKREAIESLAIPSEKITVIPRGRSRAKLGERTPERRSAARSMMGCAPDDVVVLNVGRQDWIKGQDVLIRGFDLAAAKDSRLHLWIAGRQGDASSRVSEGLQAAEHESRISLLGHRTDVPELLCAADIFVVASHHEGFGGALLEAMALRCPIIATDARCFIEVLGTPPVGRIVPRGNSDALAEAIRGLAQRPSERQELAADGHARYLREYELKQVVTQTLKLYLTTRALIESVEKAKTFNP